jgi:hypothetical protein
MHKSIKTNSPSMDHNSNTVFTHTFPSTQRESTTITASSKDCKIYNVVENFF